MMFPSILGLSSAWINLPRATVKRLIALGNEEPKTRFTLLELEHHVADSTPPTIDVGVPELLLRTSVAIDEDRRAS